MTKDKYGQLIFTETEICNLFLEDRSRKMKCALVDKDITFSSELELNDVPNIIRYIESDKTVEEFDFVQQSNWHMPQRYKELDVVQYILDKCEGDEAKLQRVGQELLLYVDRGLLPLLQYLVYLVDVMRENNVIWGVGRGSSVASYVLFLIGIHKIDSIFYGLDISEFLR